MARAKGQVRIQQHLPSAIRPYITQLGDLLEAQPIPAPDIREGDGEYRVSTIIEAAVAKLDRDIRLNVKIPFEWWQQFGEEYERIRDDSNRSTPSVVNIKYSEAVGDWLQNIAHWLEAHDIQADKLYYGDAVHRRRLAVYAVLYTIKTAGKGT